MYPNDEREKGMLQFGQTFRQVKVDGLFPVIDPDDEFRDSRYHYFLTAVVDHQYRIKIIPDIFDNPAQVTNIFIMCLESNHCMKIAGFIMKIAGFILFCRVVPGIQVYIATTDSSRLLNGVDKFQLQNSLVIRDPGVLLYKKRNPLSININEQWVIWFNT